MYRKFIWMGCLLVSQGVSAVEPAELMNYSEELVTPHVKWNKPSSTGKIKALFLVPASGAREIAELAQRFDLDYKTIYINQSNPWTNGDCYYEDIDPQTREGIATLLSAEQYDVIILGGLFWSQYLQGGTENLLLAQISNGAGLVYMGPNDLSPQAESILPVIPDGNPLYRTDSAPVQTVVQHPIVAGLDMSLLGSTSAMLFNPKSGSEVVLQVNGRPWLTLGAYGSGRIAAFTYRVTGEHAGIEEGGGLTPRIWDSGFGSMGKASAWNYEYWEYYLSLIGRTVRWAANHQPAIGIQNLDAELAGSNIVVTVQFYNPVDPGFPIELAIEMLDPVSRTLGSSTHLITSGSQADITLDQTFLPRSGRNMIHVIASTPGGDMYDFGTASLDYQAPVSISGISLENRVVNKDEGVGGVVTFIGEPNSGDLLVVDLYDCFQRRIDRRRLAVPSGGSIEFSLSAQNSMEVQGWVEATLFRGERMLDMRRTPLKFMLTPEEREWNDFKVKSYSNMWSLGVPAYLYPHFSSVLRETGMNDLEVRPNNPQEAELTSQQGFRVLASGVAGMKDPGAVEAKEMYLQTGDKKYLVREKDLCDTNYLEEARAFIHELIEPVLPYSTEYMMYDEDTYSIYGLDFNFSEPSLEAFRNWLKEQYASLDELNGQWSTAFGTWDDVMPLAIDEMRERQSTIPYNAAPWADHRKFNEVTVIRTWNLYRDWIRELDPQARIGQSGTRPSNPYGGNDWSRLASTMDFIELYANYENQGKYVWCFTDSQIAPWSAGYAFTNKAQMWNNAIREGRGGIGAYQSISLVRPDLSGLYSTGQAAAEFTSIAQSGIGKLVHGPSVVHQGDVAIHFSANTIRSAWALGVDMDEIRDAYCILLENMGYQYFYLSDLEISNGSLTPDRFKMLILPYSVALSQTEVDAIKQYVQDGGVVFADLHPGLMTEHCSPLEQSPLEDMFGLELRSLDTVGGQPFDWGGETLETDFSGTLNLLSSHTNSYGAGYAVYSDAILATLYESLREDSHIPESVLKADAIELGMREILDLANASPSATLSVGESHPDVGMTEFTEGTSRYLVVVDGQFPRDVPVAVDWNSQTTGYIYDAVNGEYRGEAGTATLLLNDIGNVFVALPYQVAGLVVDSISPARAGEPFTGIVHVDITPEIEWNRHVIRMEVFDPTGKLRPEYSKNLSAPDGQASFVVPFAMNDLAGEWQLHFRDIISGEETIISIDLQDAVEYFWLGTETAGTGFGSVDPSSGHYASGASVSISSTPSAVCQFNGWTGTGVPAGHENDNPLSVTMDRNRNVVANFSFVANPIPYIETFESYTNGFAMPGGAVGWMATPPSSAEVTTNAALISSLADYSEPCDYPVAAANHAKVLEVTESASNLFGMDVGQIVWVDCMVLHVRGLLATDTNCLAGVQAAVGFNANDHPVVWHYDLIGESNRWTGVDDVSVSNGDWVRITYTMDYKTDDLVNSVRYYQARVNGNLLTNALAWTANDGSGIAGGSWFAMSSEPDRFSRVSCRADRTALDDLVVTTSNPMVTPQGIPFEWLASHGLTNGTFAEEELLDGDGDGVAAWKEWVGDTDPTNGNSVLLITNLMGEASGMRVYWQGGVEASQWLERSTNLVLGSWVPLFTNNPPTPTSASFMDSGTTNLSSGFYRIKARR